jgi:hypothetical protein
VNVRLSLRGVPVLFRSALVTLIWLGVPSLALEAQASATDQAGRLYSQLVDAFHIKEVRVQVGELGPERVVQVTFEDSTIFALSKPDRRKAARGVAEFIRDNFAGYSNLSIVFVSWSTKSPDGTLEMYAVPFQVAELGRARPSPKAQ